MTARQSLEGTQVPTTSLSTLNSDEKGGPRLEIEASEAPYALRLIAHALNLERTSASLRYTTMFDAAQCMPPSLSVVCVANSAELSTLLALRRRQFESSEVTTKESSPVIYLSAFWDRLGLAGDSASPELADWAKRRSIAFGGAPRNALTTS